jgi:hypothetical protein
VATKVRDNIVKWARWGVANEPRIHYRQIRPIPVHAKIGTLPLTTDCSGFATLVYKWSGAPDPNGYNFNGNGWTGSLLAHMHHISFHSALPGDLYVYGEYPGHHVVIFVQAGRSGNPLCVSHGRERGPNLIRFADEQRVQPRHGQALSILPAHDPAPKAHPHPGLHRVPTKTSGGVRRTL